MAHKCLTIRRFSKSPFRIRASVMIICIKVDFEHSADARISSRDYKIPQFFNIKAEPKSEANRYIRYICRRLRSKSVTTEAEHVKELLIWVAASGLDVVDINEDFFENYVDALFSYKKKSGDPLSWNTVNSRIAGAYRFLIWAHKEGYCPDLKPVEIEKASRGGMTRFKSRGNPRHRLSKHTNFLRLEDAVRFIDCISTISGKSSAGVRVRNKLIASLLLQSGLRIAEAVSFPLCDLPEINLRGHSTPARVSGKGGKARLVLIPNKLLYKIWEYVDIYREKFCDSCISRNQAPVLDRLFISEQGAAVTPNWIEKLFLKTSLVTGLKTVPHSLRHTYGTYHYLLNKDLAGLANLMGHESEATTRRYYLHTACLIEFAGSYSAFQDEIDRLIEV
jgi:integrase/recombinase XerD